MENIRRVQLSEIAELITKGTTPTTLGYEFQEEGVNFLKIECFDEKGGLVESIREVIMEQLSEYMPYFTSIVCALISGIVTYMVSRKQTKNEINKLIKQHELNLESQRKQYEHEIAILNLEHEHQLKLKDKEL